MPFVIWSLLIGSALLFLWLVQLVLPKVFFKLKYHVNSSLDRGIANYKEKNGRSIVYRTREEYQGYIDQYILSRRNNKTVLTAKLKGQVCVIDYDVVVLDGNYSASSVINVTENVEGQGFTKKIELPPETRCVTLIINSIDGKKIPLVIKDKPIINWRVLACVLATIFLSVLEVFFICFCVSTLFGDVFVEDYMRSFAGVITALFFAAIIAFINLLPILLHFRLRRKEAAHDN